MINTVPVRSNGVIIGAISTFRDKTEVRKLMQRLDGLVNYADALRERSHEFMNKLHVILGLLRLKSYEQIGRLHYSKQPITIRKRLALCWVRSNLRLSLVF